MSVDVQKIKDQVLKYAEQLDRVKAEVRKVLVGQDVMLSRLLIALLTGGHVLLEGVPGLAKTTAIKALAAALHCKFRRIQFTPDLLPADLIGTLIYNPREGAFSTRKGPIFANLILADEINRTPPKTQAAMLQTMQEHEVTVGSKTYPLPTPFHVFATQNPIEMEGTYVLPEAQADRFMFSIHCGYPTNAEEELVVRNTTGNAVPEITPILDANEIVQIQKLVRAMPISDEVVRYAVRLVSRSRPEDPQAPKYVKEYVRWGGSPRASQYLVLGAKARAAVLGKLCADYDCVRSVARQVLRHRVLTNFNARAQKISVQDVMEKLLQEVTP
jgi:MoxR-like ATPase